MISNSTKKKSFIPAIEINTALPKEPNQKKNNQNCLDKTTYNFKQIKCYNCQKLSHYTINCMKSSKN